MLLSPKAPLAPVLLLLPEELAIVESTIIID
jgi:hypothetical protein